MFFPLLAFGLASVIELRSLRTRVEKVRSLIPVVLGCSAFGLLFVQGRLISMTPGASLTISRVMTMVSAVIACSGVFMSYSRKASAVWVACGGLLLTFVWMFNRILI
jgi:hypothetical protein